MTTEQHGSKTEEGRARFVDRFDGDTPHLLRSIDAYLKTNKEGGFIGQQLNQGHHAITLLNAAAARLATPSPLASVEARRGEREGLETRKAISRRLDEFTRQAQEAHVDTNGADRDRSRWTFKNWRCIDVDELIELAGKALDLAPANRK